MEVTKELLHYAFKSPVPWWYGKAYEKLNIQTVVFLPMPVNLFVRWSRDFYFWLRGYEVGYREKIERAAFQAGRNEGIDSVRREYQMKLRLERENMVKGIFFR